MVLRPFNYRITRMDALLILWFIYIIINDIVTKQDLSLPISEFIGLACLYFLLRNLKISNYIWLYSAIVFGGIIQAILGNLQLWGFYPSQHNLFKLTGSFFNPGPYAGYLATVFPVALGLKVFDIKYFNGTFRFGKSFSKLFKTSLSKSDLVAFLFEKMKNCIIQFEKLIEKLSGNAIHYLSFTAIVLIMLVLPASQSRAAWLAVICSSGYILLLKLQDKLKTRLLNFSFIFKALTLSLIVVILIAGLIATYHFKKNSADGRILIWKVTSSMIADQPFFGTGHNGFKANYMDYQAEYFKANPESGEIMLAGDTNYAFNELLQQTAEYGLTGGLLLVLIFISAFLTNPLKRNERNSENGDQVKSLLTEKKLIAVSKAMLISVVVFSMFSYPAQILPIKISLIVALAYLSKNQRSLFSAPSRLRNKILPVFTAYIGKALALFLIVVLSLWGIHFLKIQNSALKDWKFAYTLYGIGSYEASIKEYDKAKPVFDNNGDFLTNYGKALSIAGEHEKALKVLQEAAKFYSNTIVYTSIGDSYKAIGQNENSEAAYLHAWHMNPSRFYPKYLLVKLYHETGQREKAVVVAKELLEKKIKVESTAIEEIREEMQKIISQSTEQNTTPLEIK